MFRIILSLLYMFILISVLSLFGIDVMAANGNMVIVMLIAMIFMFCLCWAIIPKLESIPMVGRAIATLNGVFAGMGLFSMFSKNYFEELTAIGTVVGAGICYMLALEKSYIPMRAGILRILISSILYGISWLIIIVFGIQFYNKNYGMMGSIGNVHIEDILAIGIAILVFVLYTVFAIKRNLYNKKLEIEKERQKQEWNELVRKKQEEFEKASKNNIEYAEKLINKITTNMEAKYTQLEVASLHAAIVKFKELNSLYQNNTFYVEEFDELNNLIDDILKIEEARLDREKNNKSYNTNNSDNSKSTSESKNTEHAQFNFFMGCANIDELNKRYKNLCKVYHPDVNAGNEEIFKMVQNEYEKLKEKMQ